MDHSFETFEAWLEADHEDYYTKYGRNRNTNRLTRPQPDHDILEGLPVTQWRLTPHHYGVPQNQETRDDIYPWPELPMPKESHLYAPYSRALLRAARMGTPLPRVPRDEDKDAEGDEENAEEWKGFIAPKWTKVPRNEEKPEPEYLAKRRKGLPPIYGAESNIVIQAPVMRKALVKKVDADGNSNVYEVFVQVGQIVEGEISEEAASAQQTEAPAPGTVVEGVGIVNAEGIVVAGGTNAHPTPPRRRPPPPKRKAKGPGRGRKKKVMFAPGQGMPVYTHDLNEAEGTVAGEGSMGEGVKTEETGSGTTAVGDLSSNAGAELTMQDGEDEDEENEGDESGEEDESGEDTQSQAPPAQDIPTEAVPAQDTTPIEAAPTQDITPIEAAPAQDIAPIEAAPAQDIAPIEAAPAHDIPTEAAPFQDTALTEAVSIQDPTPIEAAPETAPAQDPTLTEAAPEIAPGQDPASIEAVPAQDPTLTEAAPETAPAQDPASIEAVPAQDPASIEAVPAQDPASIEAVPAQDIAPTEGVSAEDTAATEAVFAQNNAPAKATPPQDTLTEAPTAEDVRPAVEGDAANTHPAEGLVAKFAADGKEGEVYFDDGEVDLLGSLEKSLADPADLA